ncbi:RHS repeat-associated core domain-containing protein [Saccharothrix xinjiangensis]|uniref:RHS repeat-associated core domain-containing protein n=1 Tax=Saccharothrix xinjiangensis TaxID=204798 RepID=A0ABV9Y234_9PSEU
MRTANFRRGLAVMLVATLTSTLVTALPAAAAPYQSPKPQRERPVEGAWASPVPDQQVRTGTPFSAPAPVWPDAGTVEVSAAEAKTANRRPVRVTTTDKGGGKAKVETFDRERTRAAGIEGLLFRVSGGAKVEVDYSRFRWAYGGDWAARLKLVRLPDCALSTPDEPKCRGEVVPSYNDTGSGVVMASHATPEAGALMALTAGTSSGSGTFTATSLSPSATWAAGGNTGEFTWNYSMRVPPSLGGPTPSLALSYSSSSVDGRMAASNNQPSWIGEGFEFANNFIERKYKSCSEDMEDGALNTVKTGDRCWATDNATLSMEGRAGELIKDGTNPNRWHLRNDDGTFVERRTGAGNGVHGGEHWVVTTTTGTQYWFGRATQSTLAVPVAGNHAGEPCKAGTFAASFCTQAYRWNLDHVVDLHDNTMTYTYGKETNKYARNGSTTDLATYDRASHLQRIDYGTRTDRTENAPMQVVFDTADRCLADCGVHDAQHWPDVPWDRECTASPCTTRSPTFWTTKRLAAVTTKIGGNPVEKWTLTHSFPDPGDGTRAGLWLEKIAHEGLVGGSATVPDITFEGVQLSNRVDTHSDQHAAMKWWRVKRVISETGGRLDVEYSQPDCVPGSRMPNATALHDNALRCYPVRWTPEGNQDPILDYFHKYVVTDILETDMTGGGTSVPTHYDYVGNPAWRHADDDGLAEAEDLTWSVWRGYDTVRVTKGRDAERTSTQTRYFRGMHGDKLPTGTRPAVLPAIAIGSAPEAVDEDAFAGTPREEIVYNGPGGAEVSATVTQPWQSPPTASRTVNDSTVHARHTGIAATYTRTALDAGRGHRTTSVHTTFDDTYGDPVRSEDRGDDAVPGDEKCELIDYARDTGTWFVGAVSRKRGFTVDCATAQAAGVPDADVVSDDRTYYDNQGLGVPPVKGDITKVESLKSHTGGTSTYLTDAVGEYDAYGRVTKVTDLKGTSRTAYTPTAGGPVTGTTTTNAAGWVTTTTLQPAWGSPTLIVDPNQHLTEVDYDPLGRVTAVWKPGHFRSSGNPSTKYSYSVRRTAPSVTTTQTYNAAAAYTTTHEVFDSLLRPRQTQRLDASGGSQNAVVTDTFYDSASRVARVNNPYLGTKPPAAQLYVPSTQPPEVVPSQVTTAYDGAGRVVEEALKKNAPVASPGGELVHRTTTAYAGDRVDVTPPAGGVVTSSLTDTLGRTTELRHYHAGAAAGSATGFDKIAYTYDRLDRLKTVVDPGGKRWEYDYDLRGRQIRTLDPDKGTTTSVYDDAGQLTSTTDSRGQTLAHTYDVLGRRTSTRDDTTTGPLRAEWTYDTLSSGETFYGHQIKSTRWIGADAYTKEHFSFNHHGSPISTTYTIPAVEGGLAGSYNYVNTYGAAGAPSSSRIPAVADLKRETLGYRYDSLGQLTAVRTGYGTYETDFVAATTYTAFGELAAYTLHSDRNTVDIVRDYDTTTRRLKQIWTSKQLAPNDVAKVNYEYDPYGNLTKAADTVSGDTQCFRTDHLQRLTEAWTPASKDCTQNPTTTGLGGPAKYRHSYTYNAAGDRTTLVEHGTTSGDRTTTYTPKPGTHAVAGTSTTDTTGTRTAAYTYDATGNTTSRPSTNGTQTLTWDREGHLATSTDTSGETSFTYDADGQRLIRRDPGGRTLYLPGQELRVSTSGVKTCTRYYTHLGQPIAMRVYNQSPVGGITWISADRHGTAEITIANNPAQTVGIRRTLPFGEVRGGNGTWPQQLDKGFVGGTVDNTGLIHLGAREYDSALGRFISVDPLMDLTDPQSMHGYAYANNNPLTFTDPAGLASYMCPDGVCNGKRTTNGLRHDNTGPAPTTVSVTNSTAPAPQQGCYNSSYAAMPCGSGTSTGSAPTYPACPGCNPGMTREKLQLLIDAIGTLVPAIGDAADAANCGIHARHGEYGDAALSCAAAVPILGIAAGLVKLAKGGKKLVDSADEAKTAVKCANSFTGDTHVLMADGTTKRIDEIEVGDEVANNEPGGENLEAHKVVAVHVTDADKDYVDLTVATPDGPKTIRATAHHPFYNAGEDVWEDADDLTADEQLATPGNGRAIVTGARHYAANLRTYNLTVDSVHTYYVLAGATPVLVHNCNGRDPAHGGLDDDTYDRIDGAHGPDVADGVDYQVRRMHDGSSTAADHDLPGIGHDPHALASYFASWRGRMTHTDTRTGSRVAYDSNLGVLIVTTGRNIHGYRYGQGAFESGRYVTP